MPARGGPAAFLAFDLLVLDEQDLRPFPLSQRRTQLTELMAWCPPPLEQVPVTLDHQAVQWLRDYATPSGGRPGSQRGGRVLRRWGPALVQAALGDTAEVLVAAVTGTLERSTASWSDAKRGTVQAGLRALRASGLFRDVADQWGDRCAYTARPRRTNAIR